MFGRRLKTFPSCVGQEVLTVLNDCSTDVPLSILGAEGRDAGSARAEDCCHMIGCRAGAPRLSGNTLLPYPDTSERRKSSSWIIDTIRLSRVITGKKDTI